MKHLNASQEIEEHKKKQRYAKMGKSYLKTAPLGRVIGVKTIL